jgi:hypothetical protein
MRPDPEAGCPTMKIKVFQSDTALLAVNDDARTLVREEGVMEELVFRPDGTIDCEYYAERARKRRAEYPVFQREAGGQSTVPVSKAKRRAKRFAAAFAVATGAFWATMATSPPVSEAANPGLNIQSLHHLTESNLPMSAADGL